MDQQQFDLARVPTRDGVRLVNRRGVRKPALQFGQFFLVVVDDDGVGALVLVQQFSQPVKLVAAEPMYRQRPLAVVDEPRRHLLQLGRHRRSVLGYHPVVTKLDHIVALHLLVGRTIRKRGAHLDDVARRQFVLVVAGV